MPSNDEMLYAAFRAAFVLTLDCLLRESLDRQKSTANPGGFLDVYPVLQGTAPQIQLECLLQTWDRLNRPHTDFTPLDHCVIYAGYEALAKMGQLSARPNLTSTWKGPNTIATTNDHWVTSKARVRQLAMDETIANLVMQIQHKMDDHHPMEPVIFGTEKASSDGDIIEIVGRWIASRDIVLGSVGLLTHEEQDLLRIFFEEQQGLLR
jgi:hypothetical protein